ncbi:hypothetical protein ACIQVO_35705 [Streptomyces sp. NPDC101062]|uniref:hypothetical protein n=1 Tax=unclassified Streptomyces TaxID=2593676 RepID=UPI002E798C5A|nr:hypothetical protein [Streptomyces sp. JV176]MEE1802942.1 hypothetical protein [Streptomyces sp. JV176]
MAHHVSGLGISPTSMDPRSHITDLYVFQKPGDASRTILVININPTSPIAFRIRFSPVRENAQTASVQRATGREAAADPDAGTRSFATHR